MDIQHHTAHHDIPHPFLTGDVNAHSTLWHSYTDDHRGQLIAYIISNSDHITLNTNTPTRVPNPTLQQTYSPDIITVSNTLYNRSSWTAHYHLTTYPSSPPQSTYDITTYYNKTDELLQWLPRREQSLWHSIYASVSQPVLHGALVLRGASSRAPRDMT